MSTELTPLPAGLPAVVTAALELTTSAIFSPEDGQYEGEAVTGVALTGPVPEEALRAALSAAQDAVRPSGPAGATQALKRLKTTARGKENGVTDQAAEAIIMAEKLAGYPRDIIAMVCERQIEGSPWWPHISELLGPCERMMAPRRKLVEALTAALAPKPGALYLGKPAPESRADRLRGSMNAYLRHGRQADAARVARLLAEEEGRPVEAWAEKPMPAPASKPEAPPFVPGTSRTDKRVAELAKAWRAGGPS